MEDCHHEQQCEQVYINDCITLHTWDSGGDLNPNVGGLGQGQGVVMAGD